MDNVYTEGEKSTFRLQFWKRILVTSSTWCGNIISGQPKCNNNLNFGNKYDEFKTEIPFERQTLILIFEVKDSLGFVLTYKLTVFKYGIFLKNIESILAYSSHFEFLATAYIFECITSNNFETLKIILLHSLYFSSTGCLTHVNRCNLNNFELEISYVNSHSFFNYVAQSILQLWTT